MNDITTFVISSAVGLSLCFLALIVGEAIYTRIKHGYWGWTGK